MMAKVLDPEKAIAAIADNVAWCAASLYVSRVDAGMPDDEARASVIRWSERVGRKIRAAAEDATKGGGDA